MKAHFTLILIDNQLGDTAIQKDLFIKFRSFLLKNYNFAEIKYFFRII